MFEGLADYKPMTVSFDPGRQDFTTYATFIRSDPFGQRGVFVSEGENRRTRRFKELRGDKKPHKHTLGEINQMLEEEGFEEITQGGGLLCLPTKQHKLLWDAAGVKKFIHQQTAAVTT